MSFSYYGPLCTEVYDLTKPAGTSFGDIEFYKERLQSCKDGRILEAMAGSGRVLIPLLEAGLNMDGIDESADMLASCRRQCRDKGLTPQLYEGAIQSFQLPHAYDAIIVPAGSFLLLDNREHSLQALKCFYDHLVPGGRLILDLFLQTSFEPKPSALSVFSLPDGDIITMESKAGEVDFLQQTKVAYLKYEKWRQGQLVQTELQRFALRWYGVEEFVYVLKDAGFRDVTVSADFEYGQAPTKADQTFVYEAVK